MVIVPIDSLTPETLKRLVSEFVTRDGTDYGQTETPLERRIEQLMAALHSGEAVITWDQRLNSATIKSRRDLAEG